MYLMSEIVSLLDNESKRYIEGYRTLTSKHLTELGEIVVSKIKGCQDQLLDDLDSPRFYNLTEIIEMLRIWRKFGDEEEFNEWVDNNILSNDTRFVRLVQAGKFLTLIEVFGVDKLRLRCEDLLKKDLNDTEREKIRKLREYISNE